jgi:hypothetical protein
MAKACESGRGVISLAEIINVNNENEMWQWHQYQQSIMAYQ